MLYIFYIFSQKSINKKAFERKLEFLNQEFTKLRMLRGTCKVQVSRNNIFEVGLEKYHHVLWLMVMNVGWRKKLTIHYSAKLKQ